MEKKNKTILVTGGMGYIGSHTAIELIDQGFDVVIADNLSNSNIETLKRIEKISGMKPDFVELDLCDKEGVVKLFIDYKIDAVIHFAALKAVGESMEKPLVYYQNNLASLLNLLDVMKENGVSHFVFSSSACVYGKPDELPVSEDTPTKKAESPYGATKQISEDILKDVSSACDLQVVSLRYFNPIGAHKSGMIGELPIGISNNLAPFVTQVAAGVRDELSVFGDDYDTPDGTCVRDYIHVVDLAKAHIAAIGRVLNGKMVDSFEIYNLGTGKGSSVKEVLDTFEKVNNIKVNYKMVERRPGDVPALYADVSKAEKILAWRAELGLEEMLESAWTWEKNYRKKK